MEQIKNFIDLLSQGENAGAKTTLEDLLSVRAFEMLDVKKREMASSLFGGVSESQEMSDKE
jgi:hypothetical protein